MDTVNTETKECVPDEKVVSSSESRQSKGETPLILANSNPQVVCVTLEAQGTLLYNAEKKFAIE